MLSRFLVTDNQARPGRAIAEAADLGYDASIVPVDCDEAAGSTPALSGTPARYVAVYFASRAAAETFGAALPTRPQVLEVTVRCAGA